MKPSEGRACDVLPQALAPLGQSRQGDMACSTLYVFKHVRHDTAAESEPAARGIGIHRTLATNIEHLVQARRALDLEVFDQLMLPTAAPFSRVYACTLSRLCREPHTTSVPGSLHGR